MKYGADFAGSSILKMYHTEKELNQDISTSARILYKFSPLPSTSYRISDPPRACLAAYAERWQPWPLTWHRWAVARERETWAARRASPHNNIPHLRESAAVRKIVVFETLPGMNKWFPPHLSAHRGGGWLTGVPRALRHQSEAGWACRCATRRADLYHSVYL